VNVNHARAAHADGGWGDVPETNRAVVLLLEDDESLRELYTVELEEAGYAVEATGSGEETLERLGGGLKPDALVLDIKLEGIDGIEVARRALTHHPETAIILHSAYEMYKRDFAAWCADAYVVKSTRQGALTRTLAEVLGRRAAGEEKAG